VDDEVARTAGKFVVSEGKKVFEIRPDIVCDKGLGISKLSHWLPRQDGAQWIFIGDDRTDEEAFRARSGGRSWPQRLPKKHVKMSPAAYRRKTAGIDVRGLFMRTSCCDGRVSGQIRSGRTRILRTSPLNVLPYCWTAAWARMRS
jgi:hypothetical protein